MEWPLNGGPGHAWGVLAVGVFALSWSSTLILLCDAPAPVIAFYRVIGAVLVLLPARLRLGRSVPWISMPAVFSGILLGLHWLTWIQAVQWTTVASAVFLVSTQPVFTVAIGGLLLREWPGRRGWVGVALAVSGMALISLTARSAAGGSTAGNLLALLSAGLGAAYLLIGRSVRDVVAFIPYLFGLYLSAAIVLFLVVIGAGLPLYPYPAATWLWLGALTLLCSVVGHGSLNWAVRHLPAYLVNLVILMEPIFATLYAWWLFGQVPGGWLYPGAALVLAGLIAALLDRPRSRHRPAPVPAPS